MAEAANILHTNCRCSLCEMTGWLMLQLKRSKFRILADGRVNGHLLVNVERNLIHESHFHNSFAILSILYFYIYKIPKLSILSMKILALILFLIKFNDYIFMQINIIQLATSLNSSRRSTKFIIFFDSYRYPAFQFRFNDCVKSWLFLWFSSSLSIRTPFPRH